MPNSINYLDMYDFFEYHGNIQNLIDFYTASKEIFNIPNAIYYKLMIDDAWTYLNIDLTNGNVQLGSQTHDQFLYEQLFLNSDLTPFEMQDAQSKIGKEQMRDMFSKIKEIKIPDSCLPI